MMPLVARGSIMLPHFVNDFVGTTFYSSIVEDSNRLCS